MKRIILLILGLALVPAACGTDNSSDATSFSDVVNRSNTDANDDLPADEPTAVPQEPTALPDEPSEYCAVASAVQAELADFDEAAVLDPEALEARFPEILSQLGQLQALAPPELRLSHAARAGYFFDLGRELERVDWVAVDADASVLGTTLDEDIMYFEIDRYDFEICGIDVEFDPADDPRLRPPEADALDDSAETRTGGITITEQQINSVIEVGFTPTEAACIVDKLDLTADDPFAESAILIVLGECEIPLDRYAEVAASQAGGVVGNGDYCALVTDVAVALDDLNSTSLLDPETAEAAYTEVLRTFGRLQAFAPPELRLPIATITTGHSAIVAEFERVDWVILDLDEERIEALDTLDQEIALLEFSNYNAENC